MARERRTVVLFTFPGFQSLDLTGPAEVFNAATRLGARPAYQLRVVAWRRGRVTSSSGLTLVAGAAADAVRGSIDTLVIAGGMGVGDAVKEPAVLQWVRRAAARARRVTSVCTGAFVLAEAGLLDGRRATTHWASCDRLAERHPHVRVERDPIFVRDRNVWTSAGVTAGMDLALALVEADHGRRLALEVARWLVLFLQRPGGQAQFSAQLAAQQAERPTLRDLQAWMADHPAADLSVPALAQRAGLSPRHFARLFAQEIGRTPAAFVESVRLETARRLLESTGRSVAEVAAASGFATVETLHRRFRRALGVTPAAYRRHFTHPTERSRSWTS